MKAKNNKHLIWSSRFDLSEINRSNYHKVLKQYFTITTKRIALLAMLLVINIICEVISQYVLVLGKIEGFLSFSITFWTVLLVYLSMNGFYAIIFLEITVWIRAGIGMDVIGGVGVNLSDLTFLFIFIMLVFLMNYIRKAFKEPKSKKWSYFIVLMIAMLIAMLITSAFDYGYNKWFLIDWYYNWNFFGDMKPLLIAVFWFNIAQYAINIAIFSTLYNVTYLLVNRY